MKTYQFPTVAPRSDEVFAEKRVRVRGTDAGHFILTGAHRETSHIARHLYRFRYVGEGVFYQMLATFNARIATLELNEQGRAVAVIAVKGRAGQAFTFQVPYEWLESGKPHHARSFLRALYNTPGSMGCIVVPGKLAATIRAILALSAEGEPMP